MTWRDKEPTEYQLEYIEAILEFCEYQVPAFTGTTRGEASDYIAKYGKIAQEDVNSPTFGY